MNVYQNLLINECIAVRMMSGESGRGAALEQLPDMASRGSANGRAGVQVRVLVLD